MKPGAPIEVEVTVAYDFTATTNMEVAVTNPDTMEAIQIASAVKTGAGTEKFKITVYAPNQEGTLNLGADVIFETINGWEFSSGGAMAFTVEGGQQHVKWRNTRLPNDKRHTRSSIDNWFLTI